MIRATTTDESFRSSFTDGESTASADMPRSKGGDGRGFGPHDLLEAALATCMVITARKYARDHAMPPVLAHCEVQIDRSVAGEVSLDYCLLLEGNLTPHQEQSLREAVARCPVAKSLTSLVAIRHSA